MNKSTVVFILLGFSIMMSENYLFGFIGVPNLQIFTDFAGFIETNASSFVFNLVFCATAATIVSGAMAERTKFSAYCIYSAVISLIVYQFGMMFSQNANPIGVGVAVVLTAALVYMIFRPKKECSPLQK